MMKGQKDVLIEKWINGQINRSIDGLMNKYLYRLTDRLVVVNKKNLRIEILIARKLNINTKKVFMNKII